MNCIRSAPMVLLAFSVIAAEGGEKKQPKDDGIKFSMDYLEKTWGIKYKSHSVGMAKRPSGVEVIQVKILLEFTKDVEDLKTMRQALVAFDSLSPKEIQERATLWFYQFDEDHVSLGKGHLMGIEGELSGKKGDAFRAVVQFYPSNFKRTRKIEARPPEVKEKENKKGQ